MLELKIQVNTTGFRMAMIYFKDSYKFMNLPLRLLPKSFNFQNELQKGFFPHYLNTKDNLHFKSSTMPIKEHLVLMRWVKKNEFVLCAGMILNVQDFKMTPT